MDTPVWSLALRRGAPPAVAHVTELRHLIEEGRVAMVGPIRQELLTGLQDAVAFERLREQLRAFPDEPLDEQDFEHAARHFNICRAAGLQGSNIDFLLCAVAERRSIPILTTDADFDRFAHVLPIRLQKPR